MPIFHRTTAIAMPQKAGMQGIWEQIEAAARTCYRSEGKTQYNENGDSITAEQFAQKIVRVYKHRSVAEHATVYLTINGAEGENMLLIKRYKGNKFSRVVSKYDKESDRFIYYITSNMRVLIENKWEDDLKYMTEPTEYHERRRTVRLFTDRGVSAESNRHRCQSPTERSTRFVNYSKDDALTICAPSEYSDEDIELCIDEWGGWQAAFKRMCLAIGRDRGEWFGMIDAWLFGNMAAEWSYMKLIDAGQTPQQARRILPMDVETELVITAYEDDWVEYFNQRYYGTTGQPHPDMKEAAYSIMNAFIDVGWFIPDEK